MIAYWNQTLGSWMMLVARLSIFDSAALSSTAYGYALDPTGETTLGLIEADPYRGGTPRELLNAEDWASLQAICD